VVQALRNTANLDTMNCVVEASQPGDSRYLPATPVQISFNWVRAAMQITISRTPAFVGKRNQIVDAKISFVDRAKMGGLESLGHQLTVTSADLSICTVGWTRNLDGQRSSGIFSRSSITTYKNGECVLTFQFAGNDSRKPASLVWRAAVTGR